MFNLCITNPIATYFEFLTKKWPIQTNTYLLKKGFTETYRENFYSFLISLKLTSFTAVRQVWFLFYLYGYSMVVLFLLYRYHQKHSNEMKLALNDSKSVLIIWLSKYCRIKKLIIGRWQVILYPGFMMSALNIFLGDSLLFSHSKQFFIYFLGYAFMSVDPAIIDKIVVKNGICNLITGMLFMSLLEAVESLKIAITTSPIIEETIHCTLQGLGTWMLLIGMYGTLNKVYIRDTWIIWKTVRFLRPLSMPFYLLHSVVLRGATFIGKAAGLLGLVLFTYNVFSTTLLTGLISYLLTKSPKSIKYCFGIASSNSNSLSKYWLHEYGIIMLLLFIRITAYIILNFTDFAQTL